MCRRRGIGSGGLSSWRAQDLLFFRPLLSLVAKFAVNVILSRSECIINREVDNSVIAPEVVAICVLKNIIGLCLKKDTRMYCMISNTVCEVSIIL